MLQTNTATDTKLKIMSVQVKKDQQNGATKSIAKNSSKATKARATSPAKGEAARISLEERIQKVDELRSLTTKRQRTVETLHQLRTFQFGSDDNCTFVLTDGQGMKFATSNSNLISLLSDYFVTLLSDKVSALDDEILAFKL